MLEHLHGPGRTYRWQPATTRARPDGCWRWTGCRNRPRPESHRPVSEWWRRYQGTPAADHAPAAAAPENRCRGLGEVPIPTRRVRSSDIPQYRATRQALANQAGNPITQTGQADAFDYFCRKRVRKQVMGVRVVKTPGTQVEQGVFVDLPYSGAMCTLDVIGVDFEFRARIGACHA